MGSLRSQVARRSVIVWVVRRVGSTAGAEPDRGLCGVGRKKAGRGFTRRQNPYKFLPPSTAQLIGHSFMCISISETLSLSSFQPGGQRICHSANSLIEVRYSLSVPPRPDAGITVVRTLPTRFGRSLLCVTIYMKVHRQDRQDFNVSWK